MHRGVRELLRKSGVVEVRPFLLRVVHPWSLERSLSIEFQTAFQALPNGESDGDVGPEVEIDVVRRALRGNAARGVRVSRELCRALVALRDPQARGAVRARDVPALAALLAFWAAAFRKYGDGGVAGGVPWREPRCSSYRLRALLWGAGLTASNKVLECLVLRFADGASLSATEFALALARLHLAHGECEARSLPPSSGWWRVPRLIPCVCSVAERHRSLEAKCKSNPVSLEEVMPVPRSPRGTNL